MEAGRKPRDGGKQRVLGIPVSRRNFQPQTDVPALRDSGPTIVTFVNPHACYVAENHSDYIVWLDCFDWVLCDGIGMVMAAKTKYSLEIDRAAFDLTSLAGPVCAALSGNRIPVVLVGGAPGISTQAARLLVELFPELEVQMTFSGFDEEPNRAQSFLAGHPDTAVICGMGAPHQEGFLLQLLETDWRGLGFTCGGFFDQLIDRVDYYPEWMDRMNLRFLYRIAKEPGRLWRRYFVEYQVFLKRYFAAGKER